MRHDLVPATRPGDGGQPPKWIRALFVALLAGAVEQIDRACLAEASNRPIDPRRRRDALQACHWILSEADDPLAYLSVCDVLDLPAERLKPRVAKIDAFLRQRWEQRHGGDGAAPLAAPEPLRPVSDPTEAPESLAMAGAVNDPWL